MQQSSSVPLQILLWCELQYSWTHCSLSKLPSHCSNFSCNTPVPRDAWCQRILTLWPLMTSIEVSRFRACDVTSLGTGGSGWVHPKGANSMAASGRDYRKALVGTGWAISLVCMNRLRKQTCGFVGPPFLTMMHFSRSALVVIGKSHDYWELVNEWVWFESQICRGWLLEQLGEVLSIKTQGTGNMVYLRNC